MEKYLERIGAAAKKFRIKNSSSSIVIPVSHFYDEFLVVRGLKEDGSGHPEPTYKNVGGDWGAANIPHYAEGNKVEVELGRLELDRDILLKLCGTSEGWEEVGFFIPPSDLPLMFKLVEHHVPDQKALDNVPGTPPHIKAYFGITKVFSEDPVIDEKEIHDCRKVHISDITENRVRVARGHADAIIRAHEALRSGTKLEPKIICNGVEDCPVCR